MSCAEFLEGLLDYHFAVETQEQRELSREHLRTCAGCAQEYFDLKHDIDSGAADGARPSEDAAAKLRVEVGRMVTPTLLARTRGFLSAPPPRYRLGVVACAAAMAMLALLWPPKTMPTSNGNGAAQDDDVQETRLALPTRHFNSHSLQPMRTMPASTVDSARVDALSITYY